MNIFFLKNSSLLLRPNGKIKFLMSQNENPQILDVGCGNNSPFRIKSLLPFCKYTGIDIQDYNQDKPNLADNYIITTPEHFHREISDFKNIFDTVLSSHNIEHCNNPKETLDAMISCLKMNGEIFLSFPSSKTIDFPNRRGCLNYFDDETHNLQPPNHKELKEYLLENGFEIIFSKDGYSPLLLRIIGFFLEPISKFRNLVILGTWEYYRFESIIWAKKLKEV
jgi:SAM-dependent methyltransferase